MWRVKRTARRSRIVTTFAVALLAMTSGASCSNPKQKSESKAMDTIAAQIQTTLAQRQELVTVKVNYQDTLDASGTAAVAASVKPGTDLEAIVDNALKLVWQSRLNPLSSIRIDIGFDNSNQRGTTRIVIVDNEKADLDQKYGPHPTK